MDIATIKKTISPILASANVASAAVFGSVARGEDGPDSDVDIIVRFTRTPGLFGYIRLEKNLSQALGRRVDLATEKSLHPTIRPQIQRDLTFFYEKS